MIVYAAIVDGVTLLDSNDAEIGEYSESVIKVLKANFDERFESVNFEIESSSESGIITVMLHNDMFGYPANQDEYYILVDAEPVNVEHMNDENTTEMEIEIEPGVTSVEIFGKIVKQDTESTESENATESDSTTEPDSTTKSENATEPVPKEEMDIECDPGMMMVNGQCALIDDTPEQPVCGNDTMFDGEKCILKSSNDTMEQNQSNTNSWNLSDAIPFKGLIYGIVSAAIISLAISLVLVTISKIFRKK